MAHLLVFCVQSITIALEFFYLFNGNKYSYI